MNENSKQNFLLDINTVNEFISCFDAQLVLPCEDSEYSYAITNLLGQLKNSVTKDTVEFNEVKPIRSWEGALRTKAGEWDKWYKAGDEEKSVYDLAFDMLDIHNWEYDFIVGDNKTEQPDQIVDSLSKWLNLVIFLIENSVMPDLIITFPQCLIEKIECVTLVIWLSGL